jgi:hypothetical protein
LVALAVLEEVFVPEEDTVPLGEIVGVFDEDVLTVLLTEPVLVEVATPERELDGDAVEVVDAVCERVARGDGLGDAVEENEMGTTVAVTDTVGEIVVVGEGELEVDFELDAVDDDVAELVAVPEGPNAV